MENIFSPSYWFTLRQIPLSPEGLHILTGFFAGLVVAGFVLRLMPQLLKGKDVLFYRITAKFSSCFVTIGIIGLLFTFFAREATRVLGARFWFVFLGILLVAWIGYIFNFAARVVPKRRKKISEYEQKKRYLPS
ncbi:MAG: hypothetical protein COV80_01105 [Parcubacteria group bacterium CG11_big_fil_rev_8_21_14_0_20_48_46]|nr:MAG: hypothetical protein COZ99_01155 [Parcubacteria group bacterium CG_4_8_14_3_um_filter_48_16]PIZ77446.1 MAG: hypothetical protein COY03_02840 [bacterium CG_4_10_14_0_2_um_filter_48_144]PJE52974.1 MAG: hypothetical protein COV80_01105 [Parcubacteria group bacterium CG11_big_fil_rev_8_21_14_0_20_48_46]